MKRNRNINELLSRKQNVFILFPAGFICGVIFGALILKEEQLKAVPEFLVKCLKEITVYYPLLFLYVIYERLKNFIFLFFCSFLPLGPYLYVCIIALLGMSVGVMIYGFAVCAGFSGIAFVLVSFFPHGIFYLFMFYYGYDYFLLSWMRRQGADLHSQLVKGEPLMVYGVKIQKLYIPIAVAIMGVLTECYVNPFFVKMFVNFLN